jgi:hypothetical protein
MGLMSKFVRRRGKSNEIDVPVLSSQEAVLRTMRNMANGAPAAVAKAGSEIATALNTVETAILAIDTVADLLIEAELLADTARDTESAGRRALVANRYLSLLDKIGETVARSSHNGMNLLDGNEPTYEIELDADRRASIMLHGANLSADAGGLALTRPRESFASTTEIERTIAEIDAARRTADRVADLFADSAAVLAERLSRLDQDFGPNAAIATQQSGAAH